MTRPPRSRGQTHAAEIGTLGNLSRSVLLARWRNLHGVDPPKHVTQDLLARGLAQSLQEQSLGGLTRSEQRALMTLAAGGKDPRSKALKAGTRLYREWQGVSHEVLITDNGCRWRGKDYRSLSQVARAITGTRWSGPRFFGLTP
ncbi:MAG: DUF2924 domain-containing protein [Anaerolineae bacterium]|nr:DUF2924 domain-containing protein [Anaerolineae bacterium]